MSEDETQHQAPWWSHSLWNLGPLAVIALVLVGVLIGAVPSPLASLERELSDIKQIHDEQTRIMRAICRNVARTDHDRDQCY